MAEFVYMEGFIFRTSIVSYLSYLCTILSHSVRSSYTALPDVTLLLRTRTCNKKFKEGFLFLGAQAPLKLKTNYHNRNYSIPKKQYTSLRP